MKIYTVWGLSNLREGLELRVEAFEHDPGYGCGGGLTREYELVEEATEEVLASGTTCGCGRGCGGRGCIRDDWGQFDTDLEAFRDAPIDYAL